MDRRIGEWLYCCCAAVPLAFCNGGVTVFIMSVMFVVSQQRRLAIVASRKCETTEEIRVAKRVAGGGGLGAKS